MKKIILILALSLFLTSCLAQKKSVLIDGYDSTELKKLNAWVDDADGVIILNPSANSQISYIVKPGEFKSGKEYVFWLMIQDCGSCRVKRAEVLDFAMTSMQAQRDQASAAKRVEELDK